eukprot:3749223-Rhodomonas_salina.1
MLEPRVFLGAHPAEVFDGALPQQLSAGLPATLLPSAASPRASLAPWDSPRIPHYISSCVSHAPHHTSPHTHSSCSLSFFPSLSRPPDPASPHRTCAQLPARPAALLPNPTLHQTLPGLRHHQQQRRPSARARSPAPPAPSPALPSSARTLWAGATCGGSAERRGGQERGGQEGGGQEKERW